MHALSDHGQVILPLSLSLSLLVAYPRTELAYIVYYPHASGRLHRVAEQVSHFEDMLGCWGWCFAFLGRQNAP